MHLAYKQQPKGPTNLRQAIEREFLRAGWGVSRKSGVTYLCATCGKTFESPGTITDPATWGPHGGEPAEVCHYFETPSGRVTWQNAKGVKQSKPIPKPKRGEYKVSLIYR